MLRFAATLGALAVLGACASGPEISRWSRAPISSDQYESHPMFDPESGDLVFVRSTPEFRDWRLMISTCERRGRWGAPQPIPFAAPGAAEADPFFTPDGRTFYFISTRPFSSAPKTDLDIWRVSRDRHGRWGTPEHLPEPVNSSGQEWYPRLNRDGWLYFGSSREGGEGRTDIYRAQEDGVGGWRVQNLGPRINTPGDEYEADFSADGTSMLLMADDDLYTSRLNDGRWSQREKLGGTINTPTMEVGGLLSPDGRSFLFSRDSGDPAISGEIYLYRSATNFPPRCRR